MSYNFYIHFQICFKLHQRESCLITVLTGNYDDWGSPNVSDWRTINLTRAIAFPVQLILAVCFYKVSTSVGILSRAMDKQRTLKQLIELVVLKSGPREPLIIHDAAREWRAETSLRATTKDKQRRRRTLGELLALLRLPSGSYRGRSHKLVFSWQVGRTFKTDRRWRTFISSGVSRETQDRARKLEKEEGKENP